MPVRSLTTAQTDTSSKVPMNKTSPSNAQKRETGTTQTFQPVNVGSNNAVVIALLFDT